MDAGQTNLWFSQNTSSHVFADHHRREMGIGAHNVRHDRRVDNAKSLESKHPAVGIDHTSGIILPAHTATADGVLPILAVCEQPIIQLNLGGQLDGLVARYV